MTFTLFQKAAMHPVFKTSFASGVAACVAACVTACVAACTALVLLTSCSGGSNYEAPQVSMTVSNGAGVNGTIVITLASLQAPITTANFLAYVNSGQYNGTLFHRSSPGFVLQGGGYAGPLVANSTPLPREKPTNAPIVLEDNTGLLNTKYTVAMARLNAPDSATAQFFVNMADNAFLNAGPAGRGYAVFGTVTEGTDVLTAMAAAPCTAWRALLPAGDCLPSPNITISNVRQTR
jgi:cyclophilin family peptidyl-prolyl cis-trans isomerase